MFKRKALIAILVVLGFFLACAWYLSRQYVAPILMYHSVSPYFNKIDRLTVSPRTFERQMRFLRENNYNVLPLEKLAGLIGRKKKIPSKTVAITFDDGMQDNYAYAFTVLKKYNIPATIFIIIDEVGRDKFKLSWQEIREMRDSGLVSFGSHAMGPRVLTDIASQEELRRQLFDSKKILEEMLGQKAASFSYPEGRFNDSIRQLAIDAGYSLAVATTPGRKYPNDDVFALKRLRVSEKASNMFLFGLECSGLFTFMKEYKKK